MLKMQTLSNMFDERNPYNLIDSKKECARCYTWEIIALILAIVGLIATFGLIFAAEYVGTYLLFGFIIAGSPDNNRVSGCPNNVSACPDEHKMLCYQDNMSVCYGLGLVVLAGVLIGPIIIFVIVNHLFKGIYFVFDKIIKSYEVASNMSENKQNNFDIALPDLPENNVELDIENVSTDVSKSDD